jgi:hypothetical protein
MSNSTLALSLAALAFMMTVIWGGPLLRILRYFKVGKIIRVEEPAKHFNKMGTPTMGGVMIILPVALITVLLNAASLLGMEILGQSVLVPLLVLLAYGMLGALDDWEGIRGKRKGEGMRIRTKLLMQILLAVGIACVLKFLLKVPDLFLPGIQGEITVSAWVYIPVAAFIIVGASNAVNFTDGLDGLAGLISHHFCRLRRGCPYAGTGFRGTVLLHTGGRTLRLLMVQRTPGAIDHGRHRLASTGCDHRSGGPDDRSMGDPAHHRGHPGQRSSGGCSPDRLFQTHKGQAPVQDGAPAFALRIAWLV